MVKNSFKGSGGPAQGLESAQPGSVAQPPLSAQPPSLSMATPSAVMPMLPNSAPPLANIGSSPANPAIHGTLEQGGVTAGDYGTGQGLVDSAYGPQMTNGASNAYPGLTGLGGGGVLKAQTGAGVPKLNQI